MTFRSLPNRYATPLNKSFHIYTMPTLDINFIRSQFPAFQAESLQGWAFFENAGGSYTCKQVIDRLFTYYHNTKLQPYYPFPASQAAGAAMDEAYVRLAGYLNVGEDEVHIGPSTSQNTYVLAAAFSQMWGAGDEIVVSTQDHEANAGVWRRLTSHGITVKEWQLDPATGHLNLSDLDALLTENTRMVAFPHASNVVAEINPVAEIAAKAHQVGAIAVCDGVSYAPHGLPDVTALGVDIYLFSAYKTWGPHQGVMTIKRALLDAMPNQSHFFNADVVRKKMNPAGPDHAQVAALAGVAHYLDAVYAHHFSDDVEDAEKGRRVHDLFQSYEKGLLAQLLGFLRQRDDVRIVGTSDAELRAPTVSIIPNGMSVADLHVGLTAHKVMAGIGHFYGVRPLSGMGVSLETGVVRLSFVHNTHQSEIDQLLHALDTTLK